MDPETALAILRETSQAILTKTDNPESEANYAEYARTMAEHFQALDQWIARGGFRPREWNRAKPI